LQSEKVPVRSHPDGSTIDIKVRPSSTRRCLEGFSGGRIVVCVHSSPEKGKANKEALRVLSDVLGAPPSRLEVIRGQSSRDKTILVRGLPPDEVIRCLG